MTKNELASLLHSKPTPVEVVFTKVNGETRVMRCSLNETLLPPKPEEPVEDGQPKKVKKTPNPDVQNVFDTDVQGWRYFKWSALIMADNEPVDISND